MIASIDDLANQLSVRGGALFSGLGDETSGLKAQNQDDFVFNVEAGVIVVAKFFRRNAVASKDERRVHRS